MSDLLVECPIHLDAVSINDILVFKCGHGFCEPCLEEHFAHQGPSHLSCPTCRKPVRRKEAFPLFLSPAQASTATQSGSNPTAEAAHTRLIRDLKEVRAAHAECSGQFNKLQHEIDTLRQDGARQNQTMQHLRGRYELLEGRLAKEADNSARAREENDRLREEVAKLQVDNHKKERALEQASEGERIQRERVKQFQGYTEQYRRKYNLEKKKRKAIENTNRDLLPRTEDESLMVVDANAPDTLHQDETDFGWLDEACRVKGDQLSVPGDESEKESENEVQFNDPNVIGRQTEDQVPRPSLRFTSDWNLGLDTLSSEITRKRRHGGKQVGGSKIVKVKMPAGVESLKLRGGPLAINNQGHIKGTVALGSRQRFNSKN